MSLNRTEVRITLVCLSLGLVAGCASSDPATGPAALGNPATAGGGSSGAPSAGSGGSMVSGGTASGGALASGGAGAGGASASGAAGSSAQGGGGANSGGSGGGAAGGSGGASGGSGGTSNGTAKPSPGCGKSGRPANGKVQVAGQSLTDFPASYDGTKPFPLVIGLHACGNQNTEFENLTKGSAFETEYVRTFPNTSDSGQCWTSYATNSARILKQYDDLMATYCIDMNRVFAIAHSSGAQMLVNVMSHKSDAQHLNLKAISPVAADPYDVAIPIPVLYIDGKNDNQRGAASAANTLAKFRTSNICQSTSKPYAPVMTCKSTEPGNPAVDPGCIIYDGCKVPTIWCSHNDPSYGGTEHGVPCFAIKSMDDFFKSLP